MISNPTNFNHVAHMGPGDGMQVLMDLPLVSSRGGAGCGGRGCGSRVCACLCHPPGPWGRVGLGHVPRGLAYPPSAARLPRDRERWGLYTCLAPATISGC